MNKYFAIIPAALVSACVTTTTPTENGAPNTAQYTQISTRTELVPYLDKQWVLGKGQYVVAHENGALSGFAAGAALSGTWVMQSGYWCRTLTAGPPTAMTRPRDCQLLQIDGGYEGEGTQIRGTRDSGKGTSFTMLVE